MLTPEQIAEAEKAARACPACGGDGIETCDNPDHGFIDAVGGEVGRLGCPCCGHDPNHKMKGPCPECSGTGIAADYPLPDNEELAYLVQEHPAFHLHRHFEACEICAHRPFQICEEGKRLMIEAGEHPAFREP